MTGAILAMCALLSGTTFGATLVLVMTFIKIGRASSTRVRQGRTGVMLLVLLGCALTLSGILASAAVRPIDGLTVAMLVLGAVLGVPATMELQMMTSPERFVGMAVWLGSWAVREPARGRVGTE